MEIKNFRKLISVIQQHPQFLQTLSTIEQDYLVKIYKINQLNAISIVELYGTMQRKFYINRKSSNEQAWYQNELRIFIWLLFGYLFVFQKNIRELNEDDWKFFSPIFNFKSTVFFEFQSLSLLKPSGRPSPWSQGQISLLLTIISQKNCKNRWNSIARELFILSGKKYFRNPKQCRERWMNHLDPSKIHSEWTVSQDLVLLNCIKKNGKRWSVAMKQLSNTRTEHMVKNRYKSLISNESKKYPGKKQFQIENILIKKLGRLQEKLSKESNKQSEPLENVEIQSRSEKLKEVEKVEIKSEKEELFLNEFKFPLKEEEIKYEDENLEYNFIENLGNDFNEHAIHSPLFIPWFSDNAHHPFDIRDDRSRQGQFGRPLKLDDSDELQI